MANKRSTPLEACTERLTKKVKATAELNAEPRGTSDNLHHTDVADNHHDTRNPLEYEIDVNNEAKANDKSDTDVKSDVDDEEEEVLPRGYYRVRAILAETSRKYLVDWEDSPSGEVYKHSWEPKHYVTLAAVKDWLKREAQKTVTINKGGRLPKSTKT